MRAWKNALGGIVGKTEDDPAIRSTHHKEDNKHTRNRTWTSPQSIHKRARKRTTTKMPTPCADKKVLFPQHNSVPSHKKKNLTCFLVDEPFERHGDHRHRHDLFDCSLLVGLLRRLIVVIVVALVSVASRRCIIFCLCWLLLLFKNTHTTRFWDGVWCVTFASLLCALE